MNLKQKAEEVIKYNRSKYPKLDDDYIALSINNNTLLAVPIKELLDDGFVTTNDLFHPWLPFTYLNDDLSKQILEKQKAINKKVN